MVALAAGVCGLLLPAPFAPACAETRVALVIGNEAYESVPALRNPANDANAVAAALKRSGFDTITAINLDQRAMENAAIRFSRAARTADVALFYYSGHALQYNGVNYLVPVDAVLTDEADLRRMTPMDQIVQDLQQAKNLRILVLDSCRTNPFAEQLSRALGTTRATSVGRGLARLDAPQGMIVAYATQAGRTAEDGTGTNSPYTEALLRHIEKQEEIGTIFREISEDVYEKTRHTQLPELSLSIIGRFYLRGAPAPQTAALSPAPVPAAAPAAAATPSASPPPGLVSDFDTAASIDTTVAWDMFLKQHSTGIYADLARERKSRLESDSNPASAAAPASGADGLRAAAERGDPDAQHKLGEMYEKGWSVTQDDGQAVLWFRKAAEQGHAGAQSSLAFMYMEGRGVPVSNSQAMVWLNKAISQGNARAQTNLGVMYEHGKGVPQDMGQAAMWYRKAADQGWARAQCYLGLLYIGDQGVAQDLVQAAAWMRKAADQGFPDAQSSLGVMYARGQGVRRDPAQAVALFRAAASQGDDKAQNNLGSAYINGMGVPRDYRQAVIWLRKAADKGNATARDALGRMRAAANRGDPAAREALR